MIGLFFGALLTLVGVVLMIYACFTHNRWVPGRPNHLPRRNARLR